MSPFDCSIGEHGSHCTNRFAPRCHYSSRNDYERKKELLALLFSFSVALGRGEDESRPLLLCLLPDPLLIIEAGLLVLPLRGLPRGPVGLGLLAETRARLAEARLAVATVAVGPLALALEPLDVTLTALEALGSTVDREEFRAALLERREREPAEANDRLVDHREVLDRFLAPAATGRNAAEIVALLVLADLGHFLHGTGAGERPPVGLEGVEALLTLVAPLGLADRLAVELGGHDPLVRTSLLQGGELGEAETHDLVLADLDDGEVLGTVALVPARTLGHSAEEHALRVLADFGQELDALGDLGPVDLGRRELFALGLDGLEPLVELGVPARERLEEVLGLEHRPLVAADALVLVFEAGLAEPVRDEVAGRVAAHPAALDYVVAVVLAAGAALPRLGLDELELGLGALGQCEDRGHCLNHLGHCLLCHFNLPKKIRLGIPA